MKKTLLLIFTVFFANFLHAQNLVDFTVDAGEDIELDCITGNCAEIDAEFVETYNPTADHAYNVVSLPFDPVEASNPTGITEDDFYSGAIDLPFTFTFYGETYDQVMVGGNGDVVFNPVYADQYNAYGIDEGELVPDPDLGGNADGPTAAIFGAFHDIDVGEGGSIEYAVTGEAPFRAFVINYNSVPHFSCNELTTTQQIVLHETSNYIDVYITDKPICDTWNDGLAVIGIQNAGGTLGVSPPGRNTGVWEADMEAWRFKPVADPEAANFLYNLLDEDGNVVAVNNPAEVCLDVAGSQNYTAQVIYTDGDGVTFEVEDEVMLTYTPEDLQGDLADVQICDGGSAILDATPSDSNLDASQLSYSWTNEADEVVGTNATFEATATGVYSVDVTYGNCTETFQSEVTLSEGPAIDLGEDFTSCFAEPVTLDATPSNYEANEASYVWFKDGVELAGENNATLAVDEFGTYSVAVTAEGCTSESELTITEGESAVVSFEGVMSICENESQRIELVPSISGEDENDFSYSWTFNGSEIGNSLILSNVDEAGVYTLTVSNGTCTTATDIEVFNECIPEGISPGNGDMLNNCMDLSFLADRTEIKSLKIFNRYGTIVFEQDGYINQWCGQTNDGEDLPSGTYYYVIEFNAEDVVYGGVKAGWIYVAREVN